MGGMSRVPAGFSYVVRDDGEVQISRHGRAATVLGGAVAARFLSTFRIATLRS
jgi:hypothetical protein